MTVNPNDRPRSPRLERVADPDVSVVVPCFNAGHIVERSLPRLVEDLDRTGVHYEIVVVDDGSTDDTAARLEAFSGARFRVFRLEKNGGKGAAVCHGIRMARARNIVFTDDDIPYGAGSVLRCFERLRSGCHLVIGDRTLAAEGEAPPAPLLRRLMSRSYLLFARRLLVEDIRDTQCGLKGLSRPFAAEVLARSRVRRFAFDLEIILMAVENSIRIERLPVTMQGTLGMSIRLAGESARALLDLFRIARSHQRGTYRFSSRSPFAPGDPQSRAVLDPSASLPAE